jgi:hypothetical protein
MMIALMVGLAVAVLLFHINERLQGSAKAQIAILLSWTAAFLLLITFLKFGWKDGVAALVFAFAISSLARPMGAFIGSKLLGVSHLPPPERALRKISLALDSESSVQLIQSGGVGAIQAAFIRRTAAETALWAYCHGKATTRAVLDAHGATKEDFLWLLQRLKVSGAGQWAGEHYVAVSALALPITLNYCLTKKANNATDWQHVSYNILRVFGAVRGRVVLD